MNSKLAPADANQSGVRDEENGSDEGNGSPLNKK
jgi:hypothetical protein